MKISEFLINFSEQYTVQHIDDANEEIFVDEIKNDIWLIKKMD